MRSIRRILMVLALPMGFAVAGLAVSSHENPALAAKAKSSKATSAKPAKANRASTGKTGFEHQQCTWENPCPVYNF